MTSQPSTGDDPSATDPTDPDQPEDPAPGATPPWRARADRIWHYARWPVLAGAGLFALLVVVAAWIWFTTDLPATAGAGESAVVLDRNGTELAVLAQDGVRLEVPFEQMAPSVPDALVAAEDRRFYDHTGVDPLGIARAVWNNVRNDELQGGSTITQQLVKNVYLDSDRTFTRKVREAVLAMKLERSSSKEEILERYLNEVYFGRGAYGIEAAARAYFDSSAAELRPEQAALLAAVLRAPERLDPSDDPDAAEERRNAVLDVMVEMETLSEAEGEAARAAPIEVVDGPAATTSLTAGVAPHFVERVRADIVERFGERALYDRGLVIHTTLDIPDQQAAEAAVAANLDDPDDPQAAVIGIDRTGAVRAWVGGRDHDALAVDLVSGGGGSGRQPGSTFKPVVLAANFEAGFGAGQQYPAPAEITLDVPPEPWTVSNAGGQDYGTLTLLDATVNSVNTVYAQVLAQIGPEAVAEMADRLGIGRELEAQPSIALGTEEVSPLELATVFSTFSRSGERIDPYTITRVETTDGAVLWEAEVEAEEVIEPRIADTVSAVLAETPRRGTATRAALDRPMAAKTGTTQRNADAWLAGYTPQYTAVVWMGYADGNRSMDTVDGERVQGGSIPAQIWHDFMVEALADVEPTEFPEPDPELLEDPTADLRLTVSPTRADPGDRVVVDGTGYEVCVNGWQAALEGPATAESPPDGGSTESRRSAELTVPAGVPPGEYQVVARCDFGTGLRPYGPTAVLRVGPEPTTTTSSTTSTTEPGENGRGRDDDGNGPPGQETTTTSTTTTTTTTVPEDGDEAGAGA